MHPVDEQLPILYRTVGVLQIQRSGPDGLDLRARKLDARLVPVLHEVVVEGLAVLGRDLDSFFSVGLTSFLEGFIIIPYFPRIFKRKSQLAFSGGYAIIK